MGNNGLSLFFSLTVAEENHTAWARDFDTRAADLLFQVVSRRCERRSLVLTTNLPFSEWTNIFPNAATTTALIDRVVHHAEIITIEGSSYRRRVAETRRKSSPPSST